MLGQKDYKGLSLEIALDRFEKVKAIIDEVYPKIEKDKKLKETTDKFLAQVKQYISTTEKRIKNKYNYVEYNNTSYTYTRKLSKSHKKINISHKKKKYFTNRRQKRGKK